MESFKKAATHESSESGDYETHRKEYSYRTNVLYAARSFAKIAGVVAALTGGAEKVHAGKFQHGSYLTPAQLSLIETQLQHTQKTDIQLANGRTLELPTSMEVGSAVDVFEPRTKKPTRVIIEYRQNHPHETDEMAEHSAAEKLRDLGGIEESQRKIYSSLASLASRGVVQSVCSEGVGNDDARMSPAQIAAYYKEFATSATIDILARYDTAAVPLQQQYEAALDVFSTTRTIPATKEEVSTALATLNTLRPKMNTLAASHQYLIGGDSKLSAEGKITLCGAELQSINKRAWSPEIILSEKLHDPEHQALVTKAVMTDREDAALINALHEHGDAVAIVYGAAHDFSRTVAEFNYTHPTEPIALVIVDTFVYHPVQTASE